jgi:hypothetical protein
MSKRPVIDPRPRLATPGQVMARCTVPGLQAVYDRLSELVILAARLALAKR